MSMTASGLYLDGIYQDPSGCCLMKLVDYSWVRVGMQDTKFWTYQTGTEQNGEFIPSKLNSGVKVATVEAILEEYTSRWSPTVSFADGDVVVSSNGTLFLAVETRLGLRFWKLVKDNMTYGNREYIEREYGKLRLNKTSENNGAANKHLKNI